MGAHCPDWKDPTQYPSIPVSEADLLRVIGASDLSDGSVEEYLAWEFLRRNKEYAKDYAATQKLANGEFEKRIRIKTKSSLDATVCVPSATEGETRALYEERMRKSNVKGRIAKPIHVFKNKWSLKAPVDPKDSYDPGKVKFVKLGVALLRPETKIRRSVRVGLAQNEIAIRFRLDLNLPQQIMSAIDRLEGEMHSFNQRSVKKSRIDNLRQDSVLENAHYWLRAYDAYASDNLLANDPDRKRLRVSGPVSIRDQINNDVKLGKIKGKKCNSKNPPDWNKRAKEYIDEGHYLKLLYPKFSKKNKQRMNDWMKDFKWP